ncbi:glycosyltransferase family 2 protein [Clostridium neonatale]
MGNLDEIFTPGNYKDDHISFRILLAGYKLLLCKDSYIHHFLSVSYSQKPDKYKNLLKLNSNKFKQKWGFVSEYSTFIRNDLIKIWLMTIEI